MKQYKKLLKHVLEQGRKRTDRTGTGTYSVFGYQMRFDLAEGFPLVTTKKVHLKSIIHELLWMIKGDANVQYLKDHGVSIWDAWADENGDLGPVYGAQFRRWPTADGRYIDQISEAIRQLRETPDSRRIIVSAWNVGELDKMALPPCHAFFQFYAEELTPGERHVVAKDYLKAQGCNMEEPGAFKQVYDEDGEFLPWVPKHRLSCQLYQRSADLFLGVPFNIASYALLTMMVAQACNMAVGEFIWTGGDCHIYENHLNQVRMQLERHEYPLPRMILNKEVKDIFSFVYDDFTLEGYTCWPAIKAPVAV